MVIYLKIIVLKDYAEFFKKKIQDFISIQPSLKIENYEAIEYWKDKQLLKIETTFSSENPLQMEDWKHLFSQIVNDFDISQDMDFTVFEHFETVDMLKKAGEKCFVIFSVPNALIHK